MTCTRRTSSVGIGISVGIGNGVGMLASAGAGAGAGAAVGVGVGVSGAVLGDGVITATIGDSISTGVSVTRIAARASPNWFVATMSQKPALNAITSPSSVTTATLVSVLFHVAGCSPLSFPFTMACECRRKRDRGCRSVVGGISPNDITDPELRSRARDGDGDGDGDAGAGDGDGDRGDNGDAGDGDRPGHDAQLVSRLASAE